jgi:rhodanese-related sulfurtransferase
MPPCGFVVNRYHDSLSFNSKYHKSLPPNEPGGGFNPTKKEETFFLVYVNFQNSNNDFNQGYVLFFLLKTTAIRDLAMKKKKTFLIKLLWLSVFLSCWISAVNVWGQEGYKIINTSELKKMLASKKAPLLGFSLSPIEFASEHIPRSVCIPLELMKNMYQLPDDMNMPMVFYCHGPGCVKSKYAAGLAVEMGYSNVYWYREGIKGWKEAGYPVNQTMNLLHAATPSFITASDLSDQIKSNQTLFLVDIRDETSRRKFGAIDARTLYYPLYRIHSLCWELPKNRLLVLYDIRGKQASIAWKFLKAKHFKKIKVLKGGIEAWKAAGLPVK